MALVLPVMLVMVTGIFSFSISLYQKLQLSEAISTGGRFLAADAGDTDPCTATAAAIYAASAGLDRNNMTLTFIIGGTNTNGIVTGGTTYSASKGSSPSCTAAGKGGGATQMTSGWPAQIQATYPSSLFFFGTSMRSFNLSSQITEVIQ
jgi:Flp pilus assembly protein TadG